MAFRHVVVDGIKYDRAELGVDGNAGFAFLGPDLQMGEAEFVTIDPIGNESVELASGRACKQALRKLRERLGLPKMPYYFGASFPFCRRSQSGQNQKVSLWPVI